MKEEIKKIASRILPEIIRYRRHLHANPELSFQEFETQKFVEGVLTSIGIAEHQRMADTGVVALIKGNKPESKTIALRADMDA
ncbi:MAG: amidohydrolase, partial [Bacteroidota bacterium]